MEQEPVVGIGGFVGIIGGGQVAEQVLLYLVGGVAGGGHESEAMADAIDVGIDGHGVHAEGYGLHDVGGLSAYAWQLEQRVHVAGHLAVVFLVEYLGELYEVACLGVGVGDAPDVLIDVCLAGCCHALGVGIGSEEGGGDEVDALVGALGGEHYGYEQLVGGAVVQFGIYYGVLLAEVGEDAGVEFAVCHFVG